MAQNMADNFFPSWPIILNKSLEESDLHGLLGQSHKVRGKRNPKKLFWFVILDSKEIFAMHIKFHFQSQIQLDKESSFFHFHLLLS